MTIAKTTFRNLNNIIFNIRNIKIRFSAFKINMAETDMDDFYLTFEDIISSRPICNVYVVKKAVFWFHMVSLLYAKFCNPHLNIGSDPCISSDTELLMYPCGVKTYLACPLINFHKQYTGEREFEEFLYTALELEKIGLELEQTGLMSRPFPVNELLQRVDHSI